MRRQHGGWWLASGSLALGADLASTAWALAHLSQHRSVVIFGGLVRLHLVTNTGAAFGLGAGHEPVVALLSAGALLLLGVLAARAREPMVAVGLGMAVGGGLGNLTERVVGPAGLLHGPVVDWIHVSFYGPTFNLADVWLRAGLVAAVAGALLGSRRTLALGSPARLGGTGSGGAEDGATGPERS